MAWGGVDGVTVFGLPMLSPEKSYGCEASLAVRAFLLFALSHVALGLLCGDGIERIYVRS